MQFNPFNMRFRISIFCAILSLFITQYSFAQTQVYPVQVTGSMRPPNSLDLKVYANDRSSDLTFSVLLKDPTQDLLSVVPRITIEQNGTEIYVTDPNYPGKPLVLNQFESTPIDGIYLNEYLSNAALSGKSGFGMGSVDIPEGFNQGCLQFYGVERSVAVSNKFCLSGNFRLNQPPQIIKPAYNEKIKMPPVQSTIFSWQPMHLGSGNNPGLVEYTFEMVELPEGTVNANDVFETALKIFTTTTAATSLLYSQAEPTLEAEKIYAWRVTANSVMYPTSKLFQNDGKSEVSTFILYDGEIPSSSINPLDNPAPRGCSVYETAYGPVLKSDNQPGLLIAGQSVKVGYFNMLISRLDGDLNGYSGTGWIDFPMLRSKVEVSFDNLKVNKEGRVYEAERIEAKPDASLQLTPDQLKAASISQYVNTQYVSKLNRATSRSQIVSNLSKDNLKKNILPLLINNKQFPNAGVYITGIKFTAQNAYLTLIGVDKSAKNNGMSISAATAIPTTPYGLKSNAHLVALGSTSSNKVQIIPTIQKSISASADSKIYCDCNGYQKSQTDEVLNINPDLLVQAGNRLPVQLELKDKKQVIDTYTGQISALPDFKLNGFEDYPFSARGGYLKLDPDVPFANIPADISPKIVHSISKGIWIQQAGVVLPSKYDLPNNKNIALENGNMFINEESVQYAQFSKSNLINIEKGKIGNWKYSVDQIAITIDDNTWVGPTIQGQMKLPVASNLIHYSGSFNQDEDVLPTLITDTLPTTLDMPMWQGKLAVDKESTIAADLRNINNQNELYPKANLFGTFSMQMDNDLFKKSLKGNIAKTLQNIDNMFKPADESYSFGVSDMNFKNWNMEPYSIPEEKYAVSKLDISTAKFSLGNKTYPITDASVKYSTDQGNERLAISFTVTSGKSKMGFTVWSKSKDGNFEFDYIEDNFTELNCNCEEGTSYGLIDMEKEYDFIIRNQLLPDEKKDYTSGLSAVDDIPRSLHSAYNSLKKILIENTDNDFVLIDEKTLYWPLIKKNLNVVKNGNSVSSDVRIEVDKDLFDKLGFKVPYNIPKGSTLYIASLKIDNWKKEAATASVVLELHSAYDPSNTDKFMTFKSKGVPASGNSIELANVDLLLEPETNSNSWKVANYSWKAFDTKSNKRGSARIDCTSGFVSFEIFGDLILPDMVQRSSGDVAKIPFELNTSAHGNKHSLTEFVALCDDYLPSDSKEKWNIHLKDQPQVSFTAGADYSIYFDNSPNIKVPGQFISRTVGKSTSDNAFKGVVFEKFSFELIGFNDSTGHAITIGNEDGVYVYSAMDTGFYAHFDGKDVIAKSLGVKMSGWKYGLSSVSYAIKASDYSTDLTLSGSINVPLFKENPDNIKSVQFDSAWVDFSGKIFTNKLTTTNHLESSFELDDIVGKVYQSDFIPGLGFQLHEDSNLELNFNRVTNSYEPKGEFNGRGIVLLTSQTAAAYGINVPDGIDFSLHCLKFEGLKINKSAATASQKSINEYGIKSIEFGTWGVVDFAEQLKTSDESSEDQSTEESADAGSNEELVPEVSTASGKVVIKKNGVGTVSSTSGSVKVEKVAETSTASGKIIRNKEGVKSVSTASGSVKKTKNSSSSIGTGTPVASSTPNATLPAADTEPEFNGLKFGVGCTGIKAVGDNFELGIDITLSLLGDNKDKKGEKEEVKTCAINAKGGLGLVFARNSQKKFVPKDIKFNCLSLDGSIGPLDFEGGLNILRTPRDNNGSVITTGNHGSGFKAYLSATLMGTGGIQAVGQFGKKSTSDTESFYYGFVDIEAFKQSGIPIPPPSPGSPPIVDLYGAGGGIRINMKTLNPVVDMQLKKDSNAPPTDECTIPDAKYLAPGTGFSQNYEPEKGSYGGNFYLILGPWNELDNGDAPQYSIIAEPGIEIGLTTDKITGDLQFEKFKANINGYFKPKSLAKRRDENMGDAFVSLEINLADRALIGQFGMRMKATSPTGEPIIQIPSDYASTDFNTKANYCSGLLLWSFDDRNGKTPSFNFKFGGSSIGNYKSASKLAYNTAKLNLTSALSVEAGAYFQIGNDVDAMPPIKELIPQISNMESAKYDEVKDNSSSEGGVNTADAKPGIAFGAKLTVKSDIDQGPLKANFDLGLGFDINMRKYDKVTCANNEYNKIGIEGWYAQGQAYAYANGAINLDYDLLFTSGRVNVMTVGGFLLMEAKGPNPSYFKGWINGTYSVLDGLLDGSFNCKVEAGSKCEGIEAPSPLEGVSIFADASVSDGQTNVDRYDDIKIKTNLALQKDFNVTKVGLDGNPIATESYQADIKSIQVYYTKMKKMLDFKLPVNHYIKNNIQINSDKKGLILSFDEALPPNTELKLNYTFVWKKKVTKDGKEEYIENFVSGKTGDNSMEPKIETGTIKFTTGGRPQTITNGMVEYMAPGVNQRYWHQGYADTEIKFKLKALSDAVTLFPDTCVDCGLIDGKSISYNYYILLKEYDLEGKFKSENKIPITNHPRESEKDKILQAEKLSINNGEYNINVLTEKELPISKVSFPALKDMALTKGTMYELIVMKEPDMTSRLNKNTGVKDAPLDAIRTKKILKENTATLHTSFFAVSNYNNLLEKLNLTEVTHVQSVVKRRDFQHPNDSYDSQRATAISQLGESKFHSVKDDYYAFNIKNNNSEGFDYYDIMRLKRNIKLEYKQEYIPETRVNNDRYGGKGIFVDFDNWLSNYQGIGGYMRKVLYDYTKAENNGVAQYGNLQTSDGTKWNYNISGPADASSQLLQPDEVAAKKVLYKKGYTSKFDPNYSTPVFDREVEYDFLLQDLRSRIIINQMAWLSKLSKAGIDGRNAGSATSDLKGWFPGNYPAGEFLRNDRRVSDFGWILYSDNQKNGKGNQYTYIASEPGYQFSYHGESTITFPDDNNWGEMVQSKRDLNQASMKIIKTFKPNRTQSFTSEYPVTDVTEMLENSWYKFKYGGHYLYTSEEENNWSRLWGVGYPYSDFNYQSGQYGIFALGSSGWLTIREIRPVDRLGGGYENVWNFYTNSDKKTHGAVNYLYRVHDDPEDKNFPQLVNKFDGKIKPSESRGNNNMEITEVANPVFHPEKWYNITDHSYKVKDNSGNDKWKILSEGKFFKFVSQNGYILKAHHYDDWHFVGSDTRTFSIVTDDKKFPNNYDDANGYFRSVWAIVYSGNSSYFYIKNIRYPLHFLAFDRNGNPMLRQTEGGDQVQINEAK